MNVTTYTPEPDETGDAFLLRLRATGHWQSGDGTLFRYSGGRITDAEITRPSLVESPPAMNGTRRTE